jgi:hypothetical protein
MELIFGIILFIFGYFLIIWYFEIEKKAKLSYKLIAIGIGFIAAGVSLIFNFFSK